MAVNPPERHIPVLLSALDFPLREDVLTVLRPRENESILDATLGLAGHAKAFLECIGPGGHLTGLDADIRNLDLAREVLGPFKAQVTLVHKNFRESKTLLPEQFDIVFADIGLSSLHIDDPNRGFSFRSSAPLDMRFDAESGSSASDFLAQHGEKEIATVLQTFGELPRAFALAKEIKRISAEAGAAGLTTDDLRQATEKVFGYKAPKVLAQVFQAVRIAVNDELESLRLLLETIPSLLKPGGRAGIISFHSLEDRMVKQTFRQLSTPVKDETTGAIATPASFELLTKKPLIPTDAEIARNPRARSAKFRAIVKVKGN